MADTKIRNEQITSESANDGYVLTADGSGAAAWEAATGGFTNPMTTAGDVIYASDSDGTAARLGIGGDGQVLTATTDGLPAWENSAAGFANPMTNKGDLIYASDSDGTAAALAIGTDGYVLTSTSDGLPAWEEAVAGEGLTNPMTTVGDIIYAGDSDGTPARLGVGSANQVLTSTSDSIPAWAVPLPLIASAEATADDAHTSNNTWEDVNSMSVSITLPVAGKLLCFYTAQVKPASVNYEHFGFRFDIDGTAQSTPFYQTKNNNPFSNTLYAFNMHHVFTSVAAGAHTIKVQWHDNSASLDLTIQHRMLTVMACQ